MHGLGNLLNDALHRHKIVTQVNATMIVQRANEILSSLTQGPLAEDTRVITYKHDELIVACRHAGASFDVQQVFPQLRAELERSFPKKTFNKIRTRLAASEWALPAEPEGWYTS